jgi:hypothetical protein
MRAKSILFAFAALYALFFVSAAEEPVLDYAAVVSRIFPECTVSFDDEKQTGTLTQNDTSIAYTVAGPKNVELDQAVDYYNYESPGLGDELLTEVLSAINRIGVHPHAWHPLSARSRRCPTRRFPYGIVYPVRDNGIVVIAVASLLRIYLLVQKPSAPR